MEDKALRANLVEFLHGGKAHVTIEDALKGVQPEIRNVRPGNSLHSIWELLEHMRIAQEDILQYTLDSSWQSPEWPDGYWPSITETLTEKTWTNSFTSFFSDLHALIGLVQDTICDLLAEIPHGKGRTYLRQVLLVADHNSYHVGQITRTRKSLGDWEDKIIDIS